MLFLTWMSYESLRLTQRLSLKQRSDFLFLELRFPDLVDFSHLISLISLNSFSFFNSHINSHPITALHCQSSPSNIDSVFIRLAVIFAGDRVYRTQPHVLTIRTDQRRRFRVVRRRYAVLESLEGDLNELRRQIAKDCFLDRLSGYLWESTRSINYLRKWAACLGQLVAGHDRNAAHRRERYAPADHIRPLRIDLWETVVRVRQMVRWRVCLSWFDFFSLRKFSSWFNQ